MECSDEDRTNLTNIFSGLGNFTLQILSKRSNFDPLRSSGRQSSEDGTSNRPENDENDGSIDNGPSEEAGSEEDPGEERSTAQEDVSRSVSKALQILRFLLVFNCEYCIRPAH